MNFWGNFVRESEHGVSQVEKKIVKESSVLDDFSQKFPYQKQFKIDPEYGKAYLTRREAQSVYYLLEGRTMRESAQLMGLSVRTVEYYLTHVKRKFACRRKSVLLTKLSRTEIAQVLHPTWKGDQ